MRIAGVKGCAGFVTRNCRIRHCLAWRVVSSHLLCPFVCPIRYCVSQWKERSTRMTSTPVPRKGLLFPRTCLEWRQALWQDSVSRVLKAFWS